MSWDIIVLIFVFLFNLKYYFILFHPVDYQFFLDLIQSQFSTLLFVLLHSVILYLLVKKKIILFYSFFFHLAKIFRVSASISDTLVHITFYTESVWPSKNGVSQWPMLRYELNWLTRAYRFPFFTMAFPSLFSTKRKICCFTIILVRV